MPPDEEDRPGDQETTGATVYQHHDKQATTPADAVRDSTAGADNRAGAKIADGPLGPEARFLRRLHDLGAVLWTGGEGFNSECSRPLGWQELTCEENEARVARFHWNYQPFICVNTGIPVTVVDVDTKNGGDPGGMSRVPWNFGGGPVSIRLRSPDHCARRV